MTMSMSTTLSPAARQKLRYNRLLTVTHHFPEQILLDPAPPLRPVGQQPPSSFLRRLQSRLSVLP